jgi:hypothetical protein
VLAYYDNPTDCNAVSVEEMNANPGEYVAVLTFFGNYDGYVEKTITVGSAQASIPGDVTGSGEVDMDDVDGFIEDILAGNIPTDPTSDDFIRYDANQDGRIDIADAQAILNLAMGLNADGTSKSLARLRGASVAEEELVSMSVESENLGGGIVRYALNLEGSVNFTGIQMDVVTSGTILSETLTVSGMQMRANTLSNGARRILGLPGTAEQQADGTVAYVFVQGGNASFENVVLTDAKAQSISVVGDEATAINGISGKSKISGEYFDLSGRKVNGIQKGIVIKGGKKVLAQ